MKLFYYLPLLLCLTYTAKGEEIEKDTTKIRNVELNEVVVQSFKQQRDLRLEPLSASAVTGTAIQNRNITGIKEFSSFIPNLFMPDYGSKLTSGLYPGDRIENQRTLGRALCGRHPLLRKISFRF